MGRRWDYFRPGARISSVQVVELERSGASQAETIYRAVYTCCGDAVQVSHRELVKRMSRPVERCWKCAHGDKPHPARKITPPCPPGAVLWGGVPAWPLGRLGPRWAPNPELQPVKKGSAA